MSAQSSQTLTSLQEGTYQDIRVVKIFGRLNLGDAGAGFRRYIQHRIGEGFRFFVLDFGEVTFVDSSGFGELVQAVSRVTMRSGKIILLNTARINGLLAITKLNTIFEIAESLTEALNKFDHIKVKKQPAVEYLDVFLIKEEKDKLVVVDNIASEVSRSEFQIRKIPPDDEVTVDSKRIRPKWLAIVVLISLLTMAGTVYGLVWAAKEISSVLILGLVFSLALLFFLILATVVLLLSGHISETTAAKLFGGALGKIPRLDAWVSKQGKAK